MGRQPDQLRRRDDAVVGCLLVIVATIVLAPAFDADRDPIRRRVGPDRTARNRVGLIWPVARR